MPANIVTARLHLRPWRPADAEPHRALWAERDLRAVRRIDDAGRPTVEELRDRMAGQPDPVTGLGPYAIERRDEADFIGYCGLVVGHGSVEEPELAYELAQRVHGHGYATEAASAVVAHAARTGRCRLWATVREWNAPSFRVLEKVGFVDSGRVTLDAERGDTVWMTIDLASVAPAEA